MSFDEGGRVSAGTRTGSESPRRANLSAVIRHLHEFGPASRSELSRVTGLNRSTIGFLLEDLERRGLVRSGPAVSKPTTGRPSPIVSVRHDSQVVLAVEVFGDSIGAAIVGLGGRIMASRRIERPRGFRSPAEAGRDLAAVMGPLTRVIPPHRIFGIGVAVAGLVRDRDGVVAVGPNLGWQDVPLADIVRDAAGLERPVVVANDAKLASLAEHTRGAGVGCDDFILIWGEVGVGAGIIAGGRWVRGMSGYAGEIGHIQIKADGLRCQCGSRGCLETLIGEDAVLRAIGRAGASEPARTLNESITAAADGDETVRAGLREIGLWMGIGVAGLVNTLNPRRIALGGLFARMHPYVVDAITEQLDGLALAAPCSDVAVVPAVLGPDAPILGAAELAFRPLLAEPTLIPPVGPDLPDTMPAIADLARLAP